MGTIPSMNRFVRFAKDAGGWGVASELAASIFLILTFWEHSQNRPLPTFAFLVVTVILAWVGAFIAWNKSAKKLEEIETSTPKIKPKLPGAVHSLQVYQGPHVIVPFLRVRFWNDPPASYPKSIGKGVRAFISFFPSGHSVRTLEIPGRWSESDQPDVTKPLISTAPLEETTFSFGESKTVDIEYISSVDGKCYAWNNENYRYHMFQNPAHWLSELGYAVHVRLRGEMLDETFKFTFWINNGMFHFTQPS